MTTKTIHLTLTLNNSSQNIYGALIDSKKNSELTESKAQIEDRVGGEFSVWDGSITGTNLELIPGKRIVQDWYCETDGWPEGHFPKLTWEFEEKNGKTEVTLHQTGVPEKAYEDILQGWEDYYFKPLRGMFN